MKKAILLILFSITIYSCKSQEEIDFKVGYLPNLNYTLTLKQISENNIFYVATDEIIESLKNNGYSNPTITKDTTVLRSVSKTGELNGNQFPLNIEVLESSNKSLGKGMRMHGNYVNGVIKIDSISNSSMSDKSKMELLTSMETMMNQIKYPERKIKIGESIKSATKDYEMELDGTGKGQIDYDIEKQFLTKLYLKMEMNLKTELEAFSIELQTNSITDQTTEIKKASR